MQCILSAVWPGRGVLFSTDMCVQCAKGNGGTEMRNVKLFTSVT